jgi:hypothetical protein
MLGCIISEGLNLCRAAQPSLLRRCSGSRKGLLGRVDRFPVVWNAFRRRQHFRPFVVQRWLTRSLPIDKAKFACFSQWSVANGPGARADCMCKGFGARHSLRRNSMMQSAATHPQRIFLRECGATSSTAHREATPNARVGGIALPSFTLPINGFKAERFSSRDPQSA